MWFLHSEKHKKAVAETVDPGEVKDNLLVLTPTFPTV